MKTKLLNLLLFFTINLAFCQDGSLDTTFNSDDLGYGFGDGTEGLIRASAIQNDGKIIIVGDFTTYNGYASNRIVRLNSNGTIDTSFNIGIAADNQILTVKIQDNGKILLGGLFSSFNNVNVPYITRLNNDGSVDATFNVGTGPNSFVNNIVLDSNQNILVGGFFTSYNGISSNRIVRLTPDGEKDLTFLVGTGFNNTVFDINIQTNGKIIASGNFTSYNSSLTNRVVRLNINGSIDTTFSIGTGFNDSVFSIFKQNDGKILFGGNFTTFNNITNNKLVRLNDNGSVDTSFSTGTGFNNSIFKIQGQSDNKIIVAGSFTSFNNQLKNLLIRLNTDGSLDTTLDTSQFNYNNIISSPLQLIRDIKLLQNQNILVFGSYYIFGNNNYSSFTELNPTGNILNVINSGTGISGGDRIVYSIVKTNDNKNIIAGGFDKYNGINAKNIVKIDSNGEVDQTFLTGFGFNYGSFTRDIKITSDNKILIGGSFSKYNNFENNNIIKLNSNGTIDASFNSGSGFNNFVNAINIQTDNKLIITGGFTSYNGNPINRIVRLNSDGTIDTSYNVGTGFSGNGFVTKIQNNNKIIWGGSEFITFNGIITNGLIRLNADGSKDTSFNTGTGVNSQIQAIDIQPDGKIIIVGGFTQFNSQNYNRIVRINPDGSIDTTFDIGTGFNNSENNVILRSVFVQLDGKILVSGYFSSYNSIPINNLVRLNSDGSLDTSFNTGLDLNQNLIIRSFCYDVNNSILIGGTFTSYNGVPRNRIAKLNANSLSNSNFNSNLSIIQVFPNPFKDLINVIINEPTEFEIYSLYGNLLMKVKIDISKSIDLSYLTSGIYIIKNKKGYINKLIKK